MIWIRSGSAHRESFKKPSEFSVNFSPQKARFGGPFFMHPQCREDFWSELGEILPRRSYTPIEKKGLSGGLGKNFGRRDKCKMFDELEVHEAEVTWPLGSVDALTVEFVKKDGESLFKAHLKVPADQQANTLDRCAIATMTLKDGTVLRSDLPLMLGRPWSADYHEIVTFEKIAS